MRSNLIQRIFLWLALCSARYPWTIIGLVLLLTITFGLGFSTLRVDATNDAMFGKNDTAQIDYQNFQKTFGREDSVVIAIHSDEIFNGEFMVQLREFQRELERSVPWNAEVISLASVTYVDEADGVVRTSKLGDRWPVSGELSGAMKTDILESPLYRRSLLSPDGKMTLIAIRPQAYVTQAALDRAALTKQAHEGNLLKRLGQSIKEWHDGLDQRLGIKSSQPAANVDRIDTQTSALATELELEPGFYFDGDEVPATNDALVKLPGPQMGQFIDAIRVVAQHYEADGFDLRISGGPIIDEAHEEAIHRDAGLLSGLAFLVVIVALAIQLRSWVGVLLPLVVIILSLLSVLGMMGWVGIPITAVSQALPPILLTIGVISSVHLLSHFLNDSEPDFETKIRNMLANSGTPVIYAALTDVLAFMAFTVARLEPISQFGWMAAFGALLGLSYTILLLPALLRIMPVKSAPKARLRLFDTLTAVVVPIGQFSARHYRLVLCGVLGVILLALPGITRIHYAHDVLTWFDSDHPVRVDTLEIDRNMQATVPLEIVIDTGKEEGILTPDFMKNLRALQDYSSSLSHGALQVGSTSSIVDSISRVHRVLTRGESGDLPNTIGLLQQELLLYEGGGAKEIERLTDRSYSKARITVRMAWADAHNYVGLDDKIREQAKKLFGPDVLITITGVAYMQSLGALDVIDSMWSSYFLAASLIMVMLLIVLRDFKVGIASMIPNFLPVWIALGSMGYMALPVDMFMVLLGGIALAVSVDDTVHFMYTALRHRRESGVDIQQAITYTLRDVGAPLVIISIVMSCGFSTFAFSSIEPLSRFGLILGGTLVLAIVLDLIVSPALITFIASLERKQPDGKYEPAPKVEPVTNQE